MEEEAGGAVVTEGGGCEVGATKNEEGEGAPDSAAVREGRMRETSKDTQGKLGGADGT